MTGIPVIDLFAGPGGLGEGFASIRRGDRRAFEIKLSIEKDVYAHRTLELRAFFRKFTRAPDAYYAYLRGEIRRDALFRSYPDEAELARREAWLAELGSVSCPESMMHRRIREALGGISNWVLIGGPPCQAYSLAGRVRVIGEKGKSAYESDPRHHLYRYYLKVVAVHRPAVFVMENVKGLVSATVAGENLLRRMIEDLQNPAQAVGHNIDEPVRYKLIPLGTVRRSLAPEPSFKDFVIRSEEHGIPQARHRVFIVGLRSDLEPRQVRLRRARPVFVREVLGDMPKLRSRLSGLRDDAVEWMKTIGDIGAAAWLQDPRIDPEVRSVLQSLSSHAEPELPVGGEFVPGNPNPEFARTWFVDGRLKGFCNHVSRAHMRADLHRYAFAAAYAQVHGSSPCLEKFPPELLPDHANVRELVAGERVCFNDRFRVQVSNRPSTTVVSHIAKDGHYYIHYDPYQCRSLTVREAARLQTFPDNFYFEGPRTSQYVQVGNAVPPLLARQIAKVVLSLIG